MCLQEHWFPTGCLSPRVLCVLVERSLEGQCLEGMSTPEAPVLVQVLRQTLLRERGVAWAGHQDPSRVGSLALGPEGLSVCAACCLLESVLGSPRSGCYLPVTVVIK